MCVLVALCIRIVERQVLAVSIGEGQLTHTRAIAAEYAYLRAARARTFHARIEYALVSGVGTGVSLGH